MKSVIKKLWSLFNASQKLKIILLVFLIVGGTALEILGIGAVIPLIVLLSQPEAIQDNQILQQFQQWFQPDSTQSLLLWTLAGVIFVFMIMI